MVIPRPLLLLVTLFTLVGSVSFFVWTNQHGLSGTYLSLDDNGVRAIRLVESDKGVLSGQFESVTLDNLGAIKDASAAISGTTDGQNINLTFNISPLLPIPITVFGTHGWNSLTLTVGILGEPPKTRIYSRSDLRTFPKSKFTTSRLCQSLQTDKLLYTNLFSGINQPSDKLLHISNISLHHVPTALAESVTKSIASFVF